MNDSPTIRTKDGSHVSREQALDCLQAVGQTITQMLDIGIALKRALILSLDEENWKEFARANNGLFASPEEFLGFFKAYHAAFVLEKAIEALSTVHDIMKIAVSAHPGFDAAKACADLSRRRN